MSRTAGRALAILTAINLLNYVDRYVVAALVESLKEPGGLGLNDAEIGLLPSAFLVVYMIASPVFGVLGDRGARPRLIAIGVFLWSLATVLGGFAVSFITLIAARALVGIGEAAYGTIAPSMLADHYPRARRGRVLAIFSAAIPIGAALGFVIGGLVDKAAGWRWTFFIAGAPGMALAFVCAKLQDPPRGAQDDDAPIVGATLRETYGRLLSNRPFMLTVLGYAMYTFAVGGMAFWMPAFLERVRHVPRAEATTVFGGIVVVTGFAGTFIGGWLGDHLLKRNAQAYLWVSGIATLLAVPFAWVVFTADQPVVYYGAVVIAEILLFVSTGPINSAILNAVSPAERATAVALSIFTIHILGDVPSPEIIGQISHRASLQDAVMIVPVAILLSGVLWCAEAWLAGTSRPRAT